MSFNPNAPDTIGLEWLAVSDGSFLIGSDANATALNVVHTNGQEIDTVDLYVESSTAGAWYACEVYDWLTTVPNPVLADFVPGTDTGATMTGWLDEASASPHYGKVADSDESTYLQALTGFPVYTFTSLLFRGAVAPFTGDRVASVRVKADVQFLTADPAMSGKVAAIKGVVNDGYTSSNTVTIASGGLPPTVVSFEFALNPETNLPWTSDELNAMVSTGATKAFGLSVSLPTLDSGSALKVFKVWVEATLVTEDRVAFGYQYVPANAQGWVDFPIAAPDGTGYFTADGSKTYLYTFRRISGPGSISVPKMRSLVSDPQEYCPHNVHTSWAYHYPEVGRRSGVDGLPSPSVCGLLFERSSDGLADSMGYALASAAETVNADWSLGQTVATPTTTTYGILRLVVATEGPLVDGDLTVRVVLVSDGSQVGSDIVITGTDLQSPTTALQVVPKVFDTPAELTDYGTAGYYEVEMTSPATPGLGWIVNILDTRGGPRYGVTGGLNFGQSDGSLYRDTASAFSLSSPAAGTSDATLVLQSAPDPPSGFYIEIV